MAKAPTDRVNITLRIPERLRARLEGAASSEDRSLNSEITDRLERSFDERESLAELFGDDRIASFLLMLASTLRMAKPYLGDQQWRDDPEASKIVRAAVGAVMAGFTAPQAVAAAQETLSDPSSPNKLDMAKVTALLTRMLKPSS